MQPTKILVVEDDAEIAEVLVYNLERQGYEALRAETGLDACRLIERERPALLLLDLMLPDFDGRELCKMIRANARESISGVGILMLTAVAGPLDRVRGLELGADDYVTKPFSVEEVMLRVKKLLARKSSQTPESGAQAGEGQAVRDFQDMVFHELSNQLLVVRGFSDRLARNGDILPQDKVRSYARAIYQSSSHLGALAEEMLLLSSLKERRSQFVRHEVRVEELAGEVCDLLRPNAEERGISLGMDIPEGFPTLFLNRASLKIILSSLLENAVKYGRPGGRALLAAAVLPNGNPALYVEDNGIGIPEDEREQVFEKFHRGANIAQATKGSGLGLYFAKTLAEAMGGTLTLDSKLGGGTLFCVELQRMGPQSDA